MSHHKQHKTSYTIMANHQYDIGEQFNLSNKQKLESCQQRNNNAYRNMAHSIKNHINYIFINNDNDLNGSGQYDETDVKSIYNPYKKLTESLR